MNTHAYELNELSPDLSSLISFNSLGRSPEKLRRSHATALEATGIPAPGTTSVVEARDCESPVTAGMRPVAPGGVLVSPREVQTTLTQNENVESKGKTEMNDPLKMPMKTLLDHVRRNLPKVPNCRWYALLDDDLALRPLAAALGSWQSARNEGLTDKDIISFLTELAPWVQGLTQSWRPPKDEPLAPELWRCPVSNEQPKNPWSANSINFTEQQWLAKNKPELASYLKARMVET